jgi:hypothetical protein
MDSRRSKLRDRKLGEGEQYRDAANQALDQLQWCINYLHGIRKSKIARGLAHNRATIIERYRIDR